MRTGVLLCIVLSTACTQMESSEPVSREPQPPLATTQTPQFEGTAWVAETIDQRAVTEPVQSTLEFVAADKVAGRAGCNQFGGPTLVSGNTVRFGPLFSTKMACAEAAAMDQETRFLKALEATGSFRVDERGKLVLLDESGAERLRLAKLEEK